MSIAVLSIVEMFMTKIALGIPVSVGDRTAESSVIASNDKFKMNPKKYDVRKSKFANDSSSFLSIYLFYIFYS